MGLRPCSVSVVAGPDTGSLAARIRASSAGERPVSEIDGDLPGTRIFTSSIAEADVFVVYILRSRSMLGVVLHGVAYFCA